MKKCVIIYNPKSGKKLVNNIFDRIRKVLSEYNYDLEIIYTKYRGHASEIVNNIDYADLVISMGGDGTFSEIVSANVKRKKPLVLAILPQGTTNDIASMYGYGTNIITNLKNILSGTIKKVDICTINDNVFSYSACFGKFTDIPYTTPIKLKKKIGYLAYVVYMLKDIAGRPKLYDIDFEVGKEKHHGKYTFAIISNADRIAGFNNVYKDIKLDDDRFEVLFCNLTSGYKIFKNIRYLLKGKINEAPGFEFYRTNELKIKFNNKLEKNWCIDGDELEDNGDEFIIKNSYVVELLLPKKNLKKLFK